MQKINLILIVFGAVFVIGLMILRAWRTKNYNYQIIGRNSG